MADELFERVEWDEAAATVEAWLWDERLQSQLPSVFGTPTGQPGQAPPVVIDPDASKRTRQHQQVVAAILNSLVRRNEIRQIANQNYTLGYTPDSALNWTFDPPTTISEALDRLIALVTAVTGIVPSGPYTNGQILIGETAGGTLQKKLVSSDATMDKEGVLTIANDAVTFAKMQNVSAASRLIGRGSAAGAGDPEEISPDASTIEISGTTLRVKAAGIGANELAATAVVAGSYGSATQVGTFTVDADGRLTAAANATITDVTGNAATVTVADAGGDTTTWVLLGTSQTGSLAPATDAGLTYNATTNALTATTFIGALTGNADTVTTNANLTGPITSVGNATTVADAELAALAGLTSAANKLPYFTGSGAAALADFTPGGFSITLSANTTLGGTNTGDETAAGILAKLITVDGTGSGLDADLLDGQSGAFYLDSANFTGTNWTDLTDAGATTLHKHDHGGQDGLSDDDHTQYTLLAGRSGGQTLIGGTASANDLTLSATSHATKGSIINSHSVRHALTTSTSTALTLDKSHHIVIMNNATAGTVTLPAASGNSGLVYYIKKIHSSTSATVTIDGNASETIDGATTAVLYVQYDAVRIACDGSNWHTINDERQIHSAKMTRAATQTILRLTENKILFDTVDFDNAGIADATTNDRFDIRRAGKYLITQSWQTGNVMNDNSLANCRVYKNGVMVEVGGQQYSPGAGRNLTPMYVTTLSLVAGDYIEFYVKHDGPTSLTTPTGFQSPNMSIMEMR